MQRPTKIGPLTNLHFLERHLLLRKAWEKKGIIEAFADGISPECHDSAYVVCRGPMNVSFLSRKQTLCDQQSSFSHLRRKFGIQLMSSCEFGFTVSVGRKNYDRREP